MSRIFPAPSNCRPRPARPEERYPAPAAADWPEGFRPNGITIASPSATEREEMTVQAAFAREVGSGFHISWKTAGFIVRITKAPRRRSGPHAEPVAGGSAERQAADKIDGIFKTARRRQGRSCKSARTFAHLDRDIGTSSLRTRSGLLIHGKANALASAIMDTVSIAKRRLIPHVQ